MPPISEEKQKKISEQILHFLYSIFPKSEFTSKIAIEIARDEEFTKKILTNLLQKKLVVQINKNPNGIKYEKRNRWRLANSTYDAYKKYQ